jgi:hypothetical protein
MNERDFPHLVELAFPPGGFRNRALSSTHSTTSATLPFAAADVGTKRSSSMCAFAFPMLPLPSQLSGPSLAASLQPSMCRVFRVQMNYRESAISHLSSRLAKER